jgi:hypothetical protein
MFLAEFPKRGVPVAKACESASVVKQLVLNQDETVCVPEPLHVRYGLGQRTGVREIWFDVTVKANPVWNVRIPETSHPPAITFERPPPLKNRCPFPKGNC